MRSLALALLVVASAAAPASAQNRPSFDCAKATTAHERTICGSAKLAATDRQMAAAYAALAGGLTGAAKAHLQASQKRWIADWRGCDGNPARLADCLDMRLYWRTEEFKVFAKGSYPFISDHAVIVSGKPYSVDASYPQFDGTSADFGAINRRFVVTPEIFENIAGPGGSFEQSFTVARPAPDLVSIFMRRQWAYGNFTVALEGTLVDLRTGRPVGLDEVFSSRRDLDGVVVTAVRKEFADEKRGEPPADLADQVARLKQPAFIFDADRLVVTLDEVALGLAMKGYTVDIPYAALKPLLRTDGPLVSLR
ncbi:MAG: DUF1311 domain-containing protein [Alphaproteobacteria bacterium]|nr:DUF1311 domain-containing protein [Alphaproteobacteria bacterium]